MGIKTPPVKHMPGSEETYNIIQLNLLVRLKQIMIKEFSPLSAENCFASPNQHLKKYQEKKDCLLFMKIKNK